MAVLIVVKAWSTWHYSEQQLLVPMLLPVTSSIPDGLYDDWTLDARIASSICSSLGCPFWPQSLILEGGSIHVDGQGCALYVCDAAVLPTLGVQDAHDHRGMPASPQPQREQAAV